MRLEQNPIPAGFQGVDIRSGITKRGTPIDIASTNTMPTRYRSAAAVGIRTTPQRGGGRRVVEALDPPKTHEKYIQLQTR